MKKTPVTFEEAYLDLSKAVDEFWLVLYEKTFFGFIFDKMISLIVFLDRKLG